MRRNKAKEIRDQIFHSHMVEQSQKFRMTDVKYMKAVAKQKTDRAMKFFIAEIKEEDEEGE